MRFQSKFPHVVERAPMHPWPSRKPGHSIRIMELKMTKMPGSAAERMRLYRQRRRRGIQYVRIPLHVTEIVELIHSHIGR